jgi:hypothetical protein
MSLRSDKDVGMYLLKSRSDDNEKMSCYRKFNRGFNFYKENQENFCNRKCYIPTTKDDNSNYER